MEKENKHDEIDLLELLLKGINIVQLKFLANSFFFFVRYCFRVSSLFH